VSRRGLEFFGKPVGKNVRLGFVATAWTVLFFSSLVAAEAGAQVIPSSAPASTQSAATGSVSGTILDGDGALIANATVTLASQGSSSLRTATSDDAGRFFFSDVPPGNFQLKVKATGFAGGQQSGVVQPGQEYVFPQITLVVATADVNVEVTVSPEQAAEDQVIVEEKQRLFGVIPNYYVTYDPHPAPLPARLKFQLAWKTFLDPVSLGITGAIAGEEQAFDVYGGYGQGAQGYAKRYGAAYGDFVSGTLIGGALLPIVFKQDPRYFWKGTGTIRSRVSYAVANSVIRKSDRGRWQPDYSGLLGGLASSGISNLYYPAQDRNGAALTFENLAIGIAGSAAANIFQEFLLPKLTPHKPSRASNNN